MSHEQIDLKMTWGDAANIIAVVLMEGNPTGQQQAIGELKRMAWIADNAFKPLEILLFPMAGDTFADTHDEVSHYDVVVKIDGGDPIEEHEELTEEQAVEKFEAMMEKYPQAGAEDLRGLLT